MMALTEIDTFTCADHPYMGSCLRPGPSKVIFLPPKRLCHEYQIDNFDLKKFGKRTFPARFFSLVL